MEKYLKNLELETILSLLAGACHCEDTREMALALCPQTKLLQAQALLLQTQEAHQALSRFGSPSFGGLVNLTHALRRAESGGILSLREFLQLRQLLSTLRSLHVWRENHSGMASLDPFFSDIFPNSFLEDRIQEVVLSEDSVADHASPALADLRRALRRQEAAVRTRLEELVRSTHFGKFLQESLVTSRGGRFVVPVKAEHRGEIPGLVHDSSASGATVFVEPMVVVEIGNEIRILQSKEREEIERILMELSELSGRFCDTINKSYTAAVALDLIFAKAQVGVSMSAVVPKLTDSGKWILKKARHPLLNPTTVQPIDLTLGETFDTLMITGPNTGGKTVTLKTLGLLTLMAMCGMMLPVAAGSEVSICRYILSDIGDEQSIEQSLSTFSSHITNIIHIIEIANSQSLVLLDELGAGTDPIEGAALATAILQALREKGARVVATTHYAELKTFALQSPGVENASCEFDVETLRPTYRLLIGVPGRSNAFAIAERLGLSPEIVDSARTSITHETVQFEELLSQLEEKKSEIQHALEDAERLRISAQMTLAAAEQQKKTAELSQKRAFDEARASGLQIAEQARRASFALLGELERLKKEQEKMSDISSFSRHAKTIVRQGLLAIDTAKSDLAPLDDVPYELPRPLKIGDCVRLIDRNIDAELLNLPNKKGLVDLQAGAIRLRCSVENLRLIVKPEQKKDGFRRKNMQIDETPTSYETRLDLRGTTVEECLLELDRFLDSALRSGLHEFTIVHGKGTGALRRAVQQHLKNTKFVKSHRLGLYGEGEDGVTIVEL